MSATVTSTEPRHSTENAAYSGVATLPAIGQPLEGGLYAGCICSPTGQRSAVVLLPDAPDVRLSWQAATHWARGLGAELPTREAALLLFRTLRSEFKAAWYWTGEQCADDGAFAWSQDFSNGDQDFSRTSYEGRVRAVRLIHLDA